MIPLYKPHMPPLPELDNILYSGQLAYGKYAKSFEESLEKFLGHDAHVWATNSFHMAISVAISLLDIHPFDEVIASPMACLASTQPFVSQSIKVRWADIDPYTGTLDPDSVREKINTDTKAIVHNHFCGYPGYIDEINAIGREYGIPVIDDGIECFGSEYKGRKVGNCGTDITIFSFNAVRIPNTVDGGAIVIRDPELYRRAELIRDCGIDRKRFRDDLGEINVECDITLTGYSATMSDVNAYIGLQQMKDIDKILEAQRQQAEIWKRALEKDVQIIQRKEIIPNYWIFGILVPDKRECIQRFREKGWYASGVHLNNNIYSVFGKEETLPGVREFYNHFAALPCGWWIGEEQICKIENVKCC